MTFRDTCKSFARSIGSRAKAVDAIADALERRVSISTFNSWCDGTYTPKDHGRVMREMARIVEGL